jgi:hypothetical protein
LPFAELDPHRRDRDDRGFFGRYTKVNRCLTERGRRLAGIEGGIECAEVAPLLASVTDSGAGAEAAALVAPHMSRCLSCRARLKAQRTAARRPRTEGGELVRASALRGMRLRAYLIVAAPRPAAVRAELEELAEITQCAACAGDPIESTRTRDAGLAPVERRNRSVPRSSPIGPIRVEGNKGKPLSLRAIAVIACGAKQSRRH